MAATIQIQNIGKSYDHVPALKGITFEVSKSELFGLIGPDGAGKTTLFRILSTLLLPDTGQGSILGFDIKKDFRRIRNIVGYMPGRFSLYHDLTVVENLNFYATIYGTTIADNYHLIRDIYEQIKPFNKRRAGKLSGGMKQKLALCCALIHNPDILFLDEPTTGVDAVSRKEFWEMLKKLKSQGITILVSTPYMDEAILCDRVALIQEGSVMSIDKPVDIVDRFKRPIYNFQSDDNYKLLIHLRTIPEIHSAFAFGDSIHVVSQTGIELEHINSKLINAGFQDVKINSTVANIEDCFMDLMLSQHHE